jgi:tRNA (mo5U34)-methyltransferase
LTELNDQLRQALRRICSSQAADRLLDAHLKQLDRHGNTARWRSHVEALSPQGLQWHMEQGRLVAGQTFEAMDVAREHLRGLIPWRKGPLRLGGVDIETEWRSDWKWNRIAGHLDLRACRILDVGCGNGFFGWCMLNQGADVVIGCDPSPLFVLQHEAIKRCAGPAENHLLALRLEDLDPELADFDVVFSMGVLYHRRQPLDHLTQLLKRLKPGGRLVLETLIAPGEERFLLPTPDRYAGMRNVHGLPMLALLKSWLAETGFEDVICVDRSVTSTEEQRQTSWMPFHSLTHALDAKQPALTVEGLPAPLRATCLARVPAASGGIN